MGRKDEALNNFKSFAIHFHTFASKASAEDWLSAIREKFREYGLDKKYPK